MYSIINKCITDIL